MSAQREVWKPTESERAEFDARHAQALADHRARHGTPVFTSIPMMWNTAQRNRRS